MWTWSTIPLDGNQQSTFWHNYYDQNQYLPLVLTCANMLSRGDASLCHGKLSRRLGSP